MRKIRYHVAMSLDGFIAGPKGEADWIVPDPDFDFGELWAQFDTLIMGRLTYAAATARLGQKAFAGMQTIVVSRTLRQDHPAITIVPEITKDYLQSLRVQPAKKAGSGKDIWLMGGAALFGSMLALGEVDCVEVAMQPVLLGQGIPLVDPLGQQTKLRLSSCRPYGSGMVSLIYEVVR